MEPPLKIRAGPIALAALREHGFSRCQTPRRQRLLVRIRQARREERAYLSVKAEWSVWRPEVAWLTGYFSIAVWLSVSLVHFSRR